MPSESTSATSATDQPAGQVQDLTIPIIAQLAGYLTESTIVAGSTSQGSGPTTGQITPRF